MTDVSILRDLGFILLAAAATVLASRPAKVPSIVAYILAGLALGPLTGLLAVTEVVELISEIGIALLLFLVGLELSFDKIRDVGKVAVIAGLGQVLFTVVGGFALSVALGFSVIEAIFIGTALTFSSTVVVVKLLAEKNELDALYGRIAVGIFLVQDLVVIVVLTFLAGLGRPETMEFRAVGLGLVAAFTGMAMLLAAALLSARFLLARLFGWVASSSEAIFIWSLCWCFLFVLGAEVLHLSLEIGAFLAGISLAQLPYNHELRRRVHPLVNMFIAVFFVSLGVQMEVSAAVQHAGAAAVLSLFVLLGNPFIFMWIIARLGYGERTAFLSSVTVAQISEFSFIFAALGLSAGLIDEGVLALVAVIGLVTIAASAYMILYNHRLYELARRFGLLRMFNARPEREPPPATGLEGHIIVVGMNALGRRLVHELTDRGESVLAIDTDPAKLEGLPAHTLFGSVDHLSVLQEANIARAKLVVSALRIEDANNLLAYRCRALGVPAAIHAFDESVIGALEAIGVNHLMVSKNVGIKRVTDELRGLGVLQS